MSKMNRIFADSEDKLVKTTIVYADSDDGHLFYDKEKTKKVEKEVVLELFLKGITVVYNNECYKPVHYKDNGASAALTVTNGTTDATFNSAEHGV